MRFKPAYVKIVRIDIEPTQPHAIPCQAPECPADSTSTLTWPSHRHATDHPQRHMLHLCDRHTEEALSCPILVTHTTPRPNP